MGIFGGEARILQGRALLGALLLQVLRPTHQCRPLARPTHTSVERNAADLVETVTAVDGRVTQKGYDSAERLVEERGYNLATPFSQSRENVVVFWR